MNEGFGHFPREFHKDLAVSIRVGDEEHRSSA